MRFLKPIDLMGSLVEYSNDKTYDPPTAWTSAVTPTAGGSYTYNDYIYKSSSGIKTTQNPFDYLNDTNNIDFPKKWIRAGYINKKRALDQKSTTLTEGINISYTFDIGHSDTIAFFDVSNTTNIQIELSTTANGTDYTPQYTKNISGVLLDTITNILEYLTVETVYKTKIYHQIEETYLDKKRVKITISNANELVSVGHISIGKMILAGHTNVDIDSQIDNDADKVESDSNVYYTGGEIIDVHKFQIHTNTPEEMDIIEAKVKENIATPTTFMVGNYVFFGAFAKVSRTHKDNVMTFNISELKRWD